MNNELLTKVRDQKLLSKTDQEIMHELAQAYDEEDVKKALAALSYMRTADSSQAQSSTNVKSRNKNSRIVMIGVIALVIISMIAVAYPFGLKHLKRSEVSRIDAVFREAYGVTSSYDLGSVSSCNKAQATSFGDLTDSTYCSITVAKLYYPAIEIENEFKSVIADNPTNDPTIPYRIDSEETYETLNYLRDGDESVDTEFTVFGNPSETLRKSQRDELGISGFDNVVITGLDLPGQFAEESEADSDKWIWASRDSWLSGNKNAIQLKAKIDNKVKSNEFLYEGGPTTNEALDMGTAPIVVYMDLRYCSSPDFIVIDRFCVWPS